ncbi:MAG: endonuclease, partial [Verrucomicrobia bacterium]|nr:endonuclease [Verrucomicrobiota bacterium]
MAVVGGCALLGLPGPLAGDEPPAYFPLRVVAANLTSGTRQQYETAGLNILRGLQPDIVALQEFNYSNNTPANFRQMVDATWGTNFHYFRES